ncbi:MAG: hypothetical protein NTV32_09290 [Gammaproteobacteria bacterium]|nr:hypothetical protein [Gammaproteobacteria bacterium]
MKVRAQDTTRYKALQRIEQLPSTTVLRQDIADLGSDRQVSRALQDLVKEGMIVKLGYGIYAKTKKSPITDEQYLPGGFLAVAREALTRLGIAWNRSTAEEDYRLGNSQQVPANPATKLNARFRRQLSYRGMELRFE